LILVASVLTVATQNLFAIPADAAENRATNIVQERVNSAIAAHDLTGARSWEKLGDAQYELSRFQDAVADYQHALRLAPNRSILHFSIAGCYYSLTNFESAASEYSAYAKANPRSAVGYYWAGVCLVELHRDVEAIKEFKTSLAINPDQPDIYNRLAWCLGDQNRYDEERALLETRFASHPGDAEGNYMLATAYYYLGRYNDALNYYQKSLALDPQKQEAVMGLADTELRLGRIDDAQSTFAKASQLPTPDFEAHLWRGIALTKSRKFKEAVAEMETARKLSPHNRKVTEYLFLDYLYLKQFDKAREVFPLLFVVAVGVLPILFVIGTAVLLFLSFKVTPAPAPRILFSSAWILLYLTAQTLGILTLGISGGVLFGAAPILVALIAFRRQPWGAPFAFPRTFPWKKLGWVALGLFLIMPVNGLYVVIYTYLAGHQPEAERSLQILSGMVRLHPALTLLFVAGVGPVAEEILFRGLLFASLERRLGLWTIPATALIFGAFHLDLAYLVPLTMIGILLGWARWKYGTIWLPAVLHMMINGLAMSVWLIKLNAGL
jgi:tetratricopeptide (TPR) repeat protein/membrane protease YdiL (CAAX protease family)